MPVNNESTIQTITDIDFLKIIKNIGIDYDNKSIANLRAIFESSAPTTVVKNLF
jgi:hypothetical protein